MILSEDILEQDRSLDHLPLHSWPDVWSGFDCPLVIEDSLNWCCDLCWESKGLAERQEALNTQDYYRSSFLTD